MDAGDSIFVHAFGAYFGLAVSYVLGRKQKTGSEQEQAQQLEGSSYTSDLFAMIGKITSGIYETKQAHNATANNKRRALHTHRVK